MNIPKISALFETSLASSLSAAGSSFTVVSGTDRDGNALSGLYGFIIDEGSADEEFVIGTISSTTVTITYRGIDADAPNTEVAGNKKAHRRGASVKITDYPILGVVRNILNGDETLPNKLSYASHPTFSSNTELIDKKYADDLAIAGAPDSSTTVAGLVEEATQAEIEAGTAAGTEAQLFVNPAKLGAKLYYGYAADGGANDTYTATLSPVPTAYTTGMVCVIKFNTINTGAATVNLNSLGAKDIRRSNGLVLADGDIAAGQFMTLVYNGTYFELQSPIGKAQVSQSGAEIYAADSVGTDAYAVSLLPGPLAIVTGFVARFKAGTANTGACTLSVNGSSAYAIKKNYNVDLNDGDIQQNQIVEVIYDGTNWQMISPIANPTTYSTGVVTDLSTAVAANNDVTVTTGFTPRLIKLYYWIQGESSNIAQQTKGLATFNATTLVFNNIEWTATSIADSTPPPSSGAVTFQNVPNSTSGVTAGSSGGVNGIIITITINAVSATGFTIRRVTAINGTPGLNGRAKISYEAFA